MSALVEVSLQLKADTTKGVARWKAVTSDTTPDKTGESTSVALFKDWIERARFGIGVDWLSAPRMPFLGISHYPSMDGFGEAGESSHLGIDGNRFKASGPFEDTPIGKALFNAVIKESELIERGESVKDPIRISAAWWDIAHSHGSFIFERKALTDICPMCAKGIGNKTYLKGQLDHFAATRVPINPRTSLNLEEKSMAITKREDAASIIDPELADELERRNLIVGKSEALEAGQLVIKGKAKPQYNFEKDEEDKEAGADDDTEEEDDEKQKGKKKVAKGPIDAIANGTEGGYLPMGGATTLKQADDYVKQGQLISQAYSNYDLYNMVFNNILEYAPDTEKMNLIKQLTADFNERIATIKAAVIDAYLVDSAVGISTKGETKDMDTFDELRDAVTTALDGVQSRDVAIQNVQKAFTAMAADVETAINAKYPIAQSEAIAQAVKAAISPLMDKVGLLEAKIGQQQPIVIGQPQQKSFQTVPQVLAEQQTGQHAISPVTGKPSSLTDMIRRSVGIQ